MTRVVIADDQAVVRTGFRSILEVEDDLTVVGEAGDGGHAVRTSRREQPDVVLMDVRMPEVDGIEATRQLVGGDAADAGDGAGISVLIVTTFDLDEYVFSALRAGAAGFVLKDLPPEELVEAVRTVAHGDGLVAPSVTRRLISEFARASPATPQPPEELGELTEREHHILELVAGGMSNAEIAGHLVVSETTVKTHVANVLSKLRLRDRVQTVVFAYEHGIVTPSGAAGR